MPSLSSQEPKQSEAAEAETYHAASASDLSEASTAALPMPTTHRNNSLASNLLHVKDSAMHALQDFRIPRPTSFPNLTALIPSSVTNMIRSNSNSTPSATRRASTSAAGENDDPFTSLPFKHRENTPLHAIKDTLPSFNLTLPDLAPSFPSLSCFGGLGHDDEARHAGAHLTSPPDHSDDSSTTAAANKGLADLSGQVLVLGGYRGSILRDAKTGKRLWLPLRVALGTRQSSLSIGLSDQEEHDTTETVVPGKALMALCELYRVLSLIHLSLTVSHLVRSGRC